MRLIPEAVRAGELQRLLFKLHWLRHVLSLYEHRARVGDQNFLTVDFVDGARAETKALTLGNRSIRPRYKHALSF